MSVTMNLSEQPYRAQHAVLLYGQHRPSYVSVHEVAEQHDGSLRIGAGTPATMSGLRELFDQLDPSRKVRPVFFEPNVLSQGPGWLVWWMKPQTRRVWFDGSGFDDESAEVPHPGLVFAVSALGWQVFAVGGKRRPRSWRQGSSPPGDEALPGAVLQRLEGGPDLLWNGPNARGRKGTRTEGMGGRVLPVQVQPPEHP